LVKVGRVVLIQEPILELSEKPRASDYKRVLASTYGIVRQLELNLGDQPRRILDWSGNVLAVFLHGASGRGFTRDHKRLGGLMLGVPDDEYASWVMRLDLHQIAMFGFDQAIPESVDNVNEKQSDKVTATLKNKRLEAESER